MKVIYVHQYFKTPQEGGAIRSYYLAKGLVDKGFEVEMVTTHNEDSYQKVNIEGITVHYLPVPYDNSMGFVKRVLSYLKFVRKAKKQVKQIKDADILYATSTPLTVGLVALWAKQKFKLPYYFEVRDLWPTAPIQIGAVKGAIFKKWLYGLEARIYKGAEKIIALSPGMRDWIKKVVPEKEVYMIPNMADCVFFNPEIKDPKLVDFYHVNQPFVVTYFGSIGSSNHLEYFLDIASESAKQNLNINFKIVGAGSQVSKIKMLSYLKKLQNVEFFPHQNKEGVKDILNVSDATYVCFANLPVLGTNSPNKLFDSLASGKLTIVNTIGWTRALVEDHKCGFYADPLKAQDFIDKITPFLEARDLLELYKNNARSTAEKHYSRKLQIEKLVKIFNNEQKLKVSDSEVYILTA